MVNAIIFDFWGTLVENGVWSPIKQVRNILGVRLPFSEYVVRMEKAMMTNKFPSLTEAFEAVAKEFDIPLSGRQKEELIGMWNKSWMLAKPYQETVNVLEQLKEEYRLILVSNTDCFSLPKVLDKFGLEKYFDKVFLSCEIGSIKTDEEFLSKVLTDSGLDVKDCVFVGDSILSDMKAAEKCAMKAVLIDNSDQLRASPPKI